MLRLQIISLVFAYRNFDIPVDHDDFLKGNQMKVEWGKGYSKVFINSVEFKNQELD